MKEHKPSENHLSPQFEKTFWRLETRQRFREQPGFSRKKRHFEPEEGNAFAARWAEELTREAAREEIREIYENCVGVLGNKRSQMDRSDRVLECAQFRFTLEAQQDPENPRLILVTRRLCVRAELASLPPAFDQIFPQPPAEIVVPIAGAPPVRELLALLEHWEERLGGKLQESACANLLQLHLRSGFAISVNHTAGEVSFSKTPLAGVLALAAAVAADLRALGILKALE